MAKLSEEERLKRLEKRKATNLKRYGTEFPCRLQKFKDKAKQTNITKYGTPYSFQSESVKEKIKRTNLKRYGVENPALLKEFNEKAKQTCLERYGVTSTALVPEIKAKQIATLKQNYGVENAMYSSTIKEKIKSYQYSKGYKSIIDRCAQQNNIVTPLFTKKEYHGGFYYNLYPWKCNECGTEFECYYNNGIIPVCRNCHPKSISKGQEEVIAHIKSFYDGEVLVNDRTVIKPLELDIYIPEVKLAIEYNGEYWHSLYGEGYHQFKIDRCKELGIKLIYIWDSKWIKNDVKREIYKNLIKQQICRQ